MAARIIKQVPRLTHSAPLLEELGLEPLEERRKKHVVDMVVKCLENKCHPRISELFKWNAENLIVPMPEPLRTKNSGEKMFFVFSHRVV
jgi:hypothetical protein